MNKPEMWRVAFGQAPIWTKWLARWKDYSRQRAIRMEWPLGIYYPRGLFHSRVSPIDPQAASAAPATPFYMVLGALANNASFADPMLAPSGAAPWSPPEIPTELPKKTELPKENNTMTPTPAAAVATADPIPAAVVQAAAAVPAVAAAPAPMQITVAPTEPAHWLIVLQIISAVLNAETPLLLSILPHNGQVGLVAGDIGLAAILAGFEASQAAA